MKRIRIISLPIMTIILLTLACGPTIAPPGTLAPEDAAATAVAETETAWALATEDAEPPTDTPEPTGTATLVPPTPTDTPTPSATPFCDRADFVSESIPDGMEFEPDTAFTKSWRLENDGACTWTTGYSLVFDHGDLMSAPIEIPLPGSVAPGQEVDVFVDMVAPSSEGTYMGHWMLRNDTGVLFGLGSNANLTFWIEIDVVEPPPIVMIMPEIMIPLFPGWLLPRTEQVVSFGTIAGNDSGSVEVDCPSGALAVGGGFAASNGLIVYNSTPQSGGWRTYARNTTGSGKQLNVYAICLYNTAGSVSWQTNQQTIDAGTSRRIETTCPSGSIVTGGGFASSSYRHWVFATRQSDNGWETRARNISGVDQPLTTYSVCLSGVSAVTSRVFDQATILAGASSGGEVSCPTNTLLTGGGYWVASGLQAYNNTMKGMDSETWNAFARNSSTGLRILNLYATCLSFP
jgi:hypothetical protein